jgi:hypothetical protein
VIERGRDHPMSPTEPCETCRRSATSVAPIFSMGAKEFLSNMPIHGVRPLKHDNGVVAAMAIGHILVRIQVVFLTLTIDKVAKMIFLARFQCDGGCESAVFQPLHRDGLLVPFIKVTNETNVRCSPDRFPGARKSDLTDARFFQILFF